MNVLAFDTCLGAVSVAVRWQGPGGDWLMRHAHEARERGHAGNCADVAHVAAVGSIAALIALPAARVFLPKLRLNPQAMAIH